MKYIIKTLLFLTAMLTVACGEPTKEELLVGRWQLDRATESEVNSLGAMSETELQGYGTLLAEFLEDQLCLMVDRGDTVAYLWKLDGDTALLLYRNEHVDDYTLKELTKQRLVYSDSYIHLDSLSGICTEYTYTFEYNRL